MMPWSERLVTDALVVHRLTRLVTKDVITQRPREAVIRRAYGGPRMRGGLSWEDYAHSDPQPPPFAKLVTCSWCAGVWMAAVVALCGAVLPERLWTLVSRMLATASVAGALALAEDVVLRDIE